MNLQHRHMWMALQIVMVNKAWNSRVLFLILINVRVVLSVLTCREKHTEILKNIYTP